MCSSIVDENKLILFLTDEVVGRQRRKGKKDACVGFETVRQYVAAIVDLYNQQKNQNMNSNPHPRGPLVKKLLKTQRHEQHARARENLDDPGIGTNLDGYTTVEELNSLCNHFLHQNSVSGLRDRLALLLCHAALLRGDNARTLELSNLQCQELPMRSEGFTRSVAYSVILRTGKTNQENHVEYGSFLRAREVESCPVGALALYFFHRFSGSESYPPEQQKFPDISTPANWYRIKVLKSGGELDKEMDYKTHLAACEKAFQACGYVFKAKTHAMRGSATRMADIGGAGEASIKRMGRWNQDACDVAYLTSMPKEAMRALAGFSPQGGDFWLPRATVDPPAALKSLVFPELDEYLQQMRTRAISDIAAKGFLKTLEELRTVALQDSVVLRQKLPDHFLWDHSIFQSSLYREFEARVVGGQSTLQDPIEMKLQSAMPVLIDQQKAAFGALNGKVDDTRTHLGQGLEKIQQMLSDLLADNALMKEQEQGLQEYSATITLTPKRKAETGLLNSNGQMVGSSIVAGTGVGLLSEDGAERQSKSASSDTVLAATTLPAAPGTTHAGFRMSRTVTTITDAWREYARGLGGRPSVKWAYEEGNLRRILKDDTERRFWQNRARLYKYIQEVADNRQLDAEIVACHLEEKRRSLPSKEQSINKILLGIKAGKFLYD